MNSIDKIKCDVTKVLMATDMLMKAAESDQLSEKQLMDIINNSSGFIEPNTDNAIIMIGIFDTECASMIKHLKDKTEKLIALSQEKLASKQHLTS